MLACVALLFASCNQAVDDGNYVKLNDGNPVTAAMAIDAITNQRGGGIYVKLSDACQYGELDDVLAAIKGNSSVMVELDLSETWHDPEYDTNPDIFGGEVAEDDISTDPQDGSRKITNPGKVTANYFAGVKNLKSISLPFTVRDIEQSAFEGCENLEEVTINFFFTSDVDKSWLYAAEYMYDDKFILNTIGEAAFRGCKNLRTFILVSDPDNDGVDEGFPVSLSSIGKEAFKDCYSLQGVRFYNTRNMGTDFLVEVEDETPRADSTLHLRNYPAVTSEQVAALYYDDDGVGRNGLSSYSDGIDGTNSYVSGAAFVVGGAANAITIGVGAFENCTSLEYVDFTGKSYVIGDYTAVNGTDNTKVDDTISDRAFNGCEKLATIIFPLDVANQVTASPRFTRYEAGTGTNGTAKTDVTIGGALFGSGAATPATRGQVIKMYGVQSFQYTAVANETIHDLFHFTDFAAPSASDGATAGANPYHGSTAATGTDADYVEYIGARAFFGCENLTEVELPATFTNAAGNIDTMLGDGAFANTGIQYIWVHYNTNDVYSIVEDWINDTTLALPLLPEQALYWTGALVTGDPTDDTSGVETIHAWYVTPYNGDLTYLPDLPSQNPKTSNKVLGEDLTKIKADAFYKNVDVEKIVFPDSLVTGDGIGEFAFCKTEKLEAVAAPDNTKAEWEAMDQGQGAFSWNPISSVQANDGVSLQVWK